MAAASPTMNHHAFMQALMARRVMTEADAREMYRNLVRTPDESGFDSFWARCNTELSFLGLEIRRVNMPPEPEAAAVRYVGVVNKISDDLSKEATRMTPAQIALFRAFLMAVCTDSEAAIQGLSSLDALNLPLVAAATELTQPGGTQAAADGTQAGPSSQAAAPAVSLRLSATDRENVLAQLVEDGWLFGDSRSSYRLGPRTFLEMGRTIVDLAEDDVKAVWSKWI